MFYIIKYFSRLHIAFCGFFWCKWLNMQAFHFDKIAVIFWETNLILHFHVILHINRDVNGRGSRGSIFPILPACWYSEEKVFLRWFAQKKRKNSQKWPDAEGGALFEPFSLKIWYKLGKKGKKILLGWFLSILWLILVINMSESVKKQLWKKKILDPP